MNDSQFQHRGEEKKIQVQSMFDGIAERYDFLNHFLSFGIDTHWRRQAIRELNLRDGETVLDVATGTGDQGFAALKEADVTVVGADFSANMLALAQTKIEKRGLSERFSVQQADAENLPFESDRFDALTISYGIRNVGTIEKALAEFQRVLRPGGRVAILEFSEPQGPLFGRLYRFYFDHILPLMASLFSRKSAYRYLPESVSHFPPREGFEKMMMEAGFQQVRHRDLTLGITTIYSGIK